jgi:heme exporter protein A
MLEVSALCCMRGEREIFRDVNFVLAGGEWIHVRGENGAGKTTLLRTLTGLLQPASGSVAWNGIPLHESLDDFHRDLLYLGHANGIKDDLNAAENLMMAGSIANAPATAEIARAMRSLGLNPQNGTPVRSLSQGQKRRVALSRLAFGRSKLWILDEPFAALDAAAVTSVAGLVDCHLERGGSLVLTSHQDVPIGRQGSEVWVGSSQKKKP